jgi:hypothetical protein
VTDQTGKVFIYSVEPMELIIKLQCTSTTETWGIQAISNILCVGQFDGSVSLFDMGAPGKEKFTKLITSF